MFKMIDIKTLQVCEQDRRNCEKQLGKRFFCFDLVINPNDYTFSDYWFTNNQMVGVISEEDATLIKLTNPELESFVLKTHTYNNIPSNWSNVFLKRMHDHAQKNYGSVKFKNIRYSVTAIVDEMTRRANDLSQRQETYENLEHKLEHVPTRNLLKIYKGYRKTVALGYGHEHIMVAGDSIKIEDLRTILCIREHIE